MSQDSVPIHLLNAQYSRINCLILLGNSFYDMVITFPKEIQNMQQPVVLVRFLHETWYLLAVREMVNDENDGGVP